MTVSGTITFSMTAVQIVTQARSLIGIQADEDELEDHELQRALTLLNAMLKVWQADGVRTWTLTAGTPITLVQGTASYSLAIVPFELDQVRKTVNTIDLELIPLSRAQYYALPNKTSQGAPTQYYYDRQRATGTLYLWPTPDATVATINYTYRRVINDVGVSTNTLDLPQEWYEALIYGLARRLIPHYGRAGSPNAKLVLVESERAYSALKNFDTDEGEGEITIMPAGYEMGYR